MTITLGNSTLCAGQTRNSLGNPVGPEGLVIADSPGVIERTYVGASRIHPEHVGADACAVSFKVTRVFGSVADALAYATSTIFSEDVAGSLKFDNVERIANAAVTQRTAAVSGCAVAVSYTIRG